MADLQTKNFDTLVSEQVAAIQGGSNKTLIDVTIGSILRALVEAYAAVAMWLQGLILKVLAMTRAATSNGADLDSWVQDYGLVRLSATAATGQATFWRFTPTMQAIVPVGALIQSGDGSQQYVVALDTMNPSYSAAANGYVLLAGIASLTLPIAAIAAGSVGNAVAGGINTLGQAIPGVDAVANASGLTNGDDAESDVALRARFVLYIASLSKATKGAVGYAVTSFETAAVYRLVENENYDGTPHPGYFYVVVDDGSGAPPATFLNSIATAIDAVRPLTVSFGVFAPQIMTANVAAQITVAAGFQPAGIVALIDAAIAAFINALPIGAPLSWNRLFQVIYDASEAVTNVSSLTINGASSDLAPTARQVIKAGTVNVSSVS